MYIHVHTIHVYTCMLFNTCMYTHVYTYVQTTAVATDATAVFGPRSAVFSPIPPDFEELLGRQECESMKSTHTHFSLFNNAVFLVTASF